MRVPHLSRVVSSGGPATAALLLALQAPAVGQTPLPDATTIYWPVPGFGSGTTSLDVAIGDLNGDRTADAVVLDFDTAVGFFHVHRYAAAFDITPTLDVDSLAILHGTARDTLWTTSASGLSRHDYDSVTNSFANTLVDGSIRWRNALFLTAEDVDGAFGPDLLGIGVNGKTLVTRLDTGSGYVNGFTIVYQDTIGAFEAADWDGDGVPELAGLSGPGLEVFETTGALATSVSAAYSGGFLASIGRDTGGEYLCWITRGSPSAWELRLLASDASSTPLPLIFSPDGQAPAAVIDVLGVRAGDVNDDGHDDLLIAHDAFAKAIVLINNGDPDEPFDVATQGIDFEYHDLGSSGGLDAPGFADIDRDGSDDIVYPLDDSTRRLRVLSELETDPPGGWFGIGGYTIVQEVEYEDAGSVAKLHLYLLVPEVIQNGDEDHVQVVVWKQPGQDPVESSAIVNVLFELVPDEDYQKIVVDIPVADPSLPWDGDVYHYYYDLRFVEAAPGNPPTIVDATRSTVHGWTMDDDTTQGGTYGAYLQGQPSAESSNDIHEYDSQTQNPDPPQGGQVIGIDVPLGHIPNHGVGDPPDPGEPGSTILTAETYTP